MRRASVVLALLCTPGLMACGDETSSTDSGNPVQPQSSQVASVVVTPQTVLVTAGDTVRLVAATRDVSGSPLPGRFVSWSSENPAFVTVSATGLVTAIVSGRSVRISALSEGVTGTATVTTN